MADTPLFPLESFCSVPGVAHVCAAGESLPLNAYNTALAKYINDKSGGHTGRHDQLQHIDDVRAGVSQAWNVSVEEVGFAPSVADGVSIILESLDWKAGDNVCVHEDEFPSLVGPFALRGQKVERDVAKYPAMRYHSDRNLQDVVNSRTRLIAVSYVSYYDGRRVDLSYYRRVADSVGAILLVDFTQAAGYTPIDARIADFAFSACFKFLLGTSGAAIAFWNQKRLPEWRPTTAGGYSLALGEPRPDWETNPLAIRNDAMCFSSGNPAHLAIYILREALQFLNQWDPIVIERHVQTLTTLLLRKLHQEGIPSSTPLEKARHGASITVTCEGSSEIVDGMRSVGVYAWNGLGRVRFSFHGYNRAADVDRIMEVFPALYRKRNAGTFNG
ncbi:PLP-dependent transferase [Aspergillus steynii IBT 23096]|uniref:PLP-dependent transferase n=1 Tax=Aspergillus steynii IBT 23096 TaxID=1392250 RepID=A0A2I2GRQ4_9EURO|nr:PLP-dependent transferase [Aspergillus steynii IBT 23096]PLB55544.1 PLP-dependent transferase [Aspergillus steynii IBT 23096]